MKLVNSLKKFLANESGAVTVDWVVLTAAVVLIGGAGVAIIGDNLATAASAIAI